VKNLRVALIAPQPFIEIRGTSLANLRLARILAKGGHSVDVITYPFGLAEECPGIKIHRCRPLPFIRSVGIGFSPAKLLMDFSLASLAVKLARKGRFDCIHAVEEGVFIGAYIRRRLRIPLIYDMDSTMSREVGPPLSWLIRTAEKWAIRHSSLVMTISSDMSDYVRQVRPNMRVSVIPDIPLSSGEPDPERGLAQIPEPFRSRKIIAYTGSLAKYQGIDLLIRAMKKVAPQAALVVVGGDDKGIERLTRLAGSIGMMQHLLFLGKKPPEQVPDFLAAADLLVSPRRGGINPPGKIYTYMQSGKPIVATDIPAHTAVLDSKTAVLRPPTPDGIADGIIWALAHPDDCNQKAAAARDFVSGMTPEWQAEQILAAYESL
jgi:glycosyltransferase involved in cell wall biosynthesis